MNEMKMQQKASTADLIKQKDPVSLKTQKENKVKVKLFDNVQPEEKKKKELKGIKKAYRLHGSKSKKQIFKL
jgi:hypothetical protein